MSMRNRALLVGGVLACANAEAANPPFQQFFFNVCTNPTGALAQRCAETPNAGGDLSGDSESSLNPSQTLGHGRAQVDGAQARADGVPGDTTTLELGPWALRFSVHGARFDRDRGSTLIEERAVDGDSRGADFGLDYRISDTASVGAVLGIDRSDADYAAENPGTNFTPQRSAGSAEIDLTMLSVVASFALGTDGYLALSAGQGWSDGEFRRTSVFQESTRTLAQRNTDVRGRADGSLRWLSVDAGRDFVRESWSFGLYGGATWARSSTDAYSEADLSGTGLAMRFEGFERGSLLGVVGASAAYTFSTASGVFVPQLRAQWQNEFDDDAETVDASFLLDASATRYRLEGERPDRSYGEVGFSLVAVFGGGWNAYLDYTRLLSRDDFGRDLVSVGVTRDF